MNPDPNADVPRAAVFRAALLALGAGSLLLGLYALLWPTGFYEDFPLGRGWVALLPSYSEHLVRDVGGLFLTQAAVLIAAGIFLGRRLVVIALVAYLLFSVPHTIFHFLNFEPFETGDVIANVLGLGAQVVVPLGLLWLLIRPGGGPERAAGGPPGASGGREAGERPAAALGPAAGDSAGARLAGVADSSRNPLVRFSFRESRKRGDGEVMDPIRIWAHNPGLMAAYGVFELATERAAAVPERIKLLAELRAAMLAGCEWCLDYASSIAAAARIDEDDLRALPDYAQSARFSDVEKLVLDYATGMSSTPVEVPDQLFDRLREHFDAPQLVELTNVIALENHRARFNWAFGLAGQGFAEGAHCVRPEPVPASASA